MQVEQVIAYISTWLKDYCVRSGQQGFVVGISGGIDSAVTSALAARTGLPVLCVEIPIHQAQEQVSRAREHIQALCADHGNVRGMEIELTAVFDRFVTVLPSVADTTINDLALVNTRARLRMTTLYHLAGTHRYLVVGTGNKVEDFGVGFFTKYGDGGVDLSPIADLTKTEVYALAGALDIPASIIAAPPTDGLWGDDRTDADQIGATYPELEWAMEMRAHGIGRQAGKLTERQQEVLAIYDRLHAANAHKMLPIPLCRIPEELR